MHQNIDLKPLRDHPLFLEKAALWFSEKWGIDEQIYCESIEKCIQNKTGIPQWYVVLNAEREIIAGAGIIENDFHDRKDLSPNLCALFVEGRYRGQGVAKYLLDFAREDCGKLQIEKLYLVTDHTSFYEKCGWSFLAMVKGEDDTVQRMYTALTF
ncbi:GNAT family N-acetyltransferase [Oscillospiraceae bacterium MB08-C2-2]|nr:GNAT family N-acetyltransferase [Oscillospiraceae bacterium MB08-C2-2]